MLFKSTLMMDKISPKQKAILEIGKDLFWKFGIKRVTIEEICKEAKVSKMTFYKFFPNKIELAISILEVYTHEAMEEFDQIIHSKMKFSEKLEKVFLMKLKAMNDISMEFIKDIHSNPELGLLPRIQEIQMKHMQKVIQFYEDAKKAGEMRKDVNIGFLMSYSNQMVHMMEDANLMAQYKHPQDFIAEAMKMMFYGIIAKDEN